MEDTFPYTEKINFFKLNDIRHGIVQIGPPSNWKDADDYFGFVAMGDYNPYRRSDTTTVEIYKKENDERTVSLIIKKGYSFFINYKKSTIYLMSDTYAYE